MSSSGGLFVTNDGAITTPTFLLLAAVPLFWTGRWTWGFTVVVLCLTIALFTAMEEMKEEDKYEIRFNVIDAEDVLDEMMIAHEKIQERAAASTDTATTAPASSASSVNVTKGKAILHTGLTALAKKYSRQQEIRQKNQDPHSLPLLCQEAGYISLISFPTDELVVTAAVSLLALVSKDTKVRERHLHKADTYGFDRPIQCMRLALQKAQNAEQEDAEMEQESADLQRKCCLLLGAISDGDAEIACQIVQEGGLEAILDAVKWYRFHADVANWALWAIFILCYENLTNKVAVVQAGGVPAVIQTMLNVPDSQEVARHGIAILFDLLREDDGGTAGQPALDIWRIRNTALTAGLHRAVLHAMDKFCGAMDIMMMGRELLVGTDFPGNIPEYQPVR
jgi:hypothetical protein